MGKKQGNAVYRICFVSPLLAGWHCVNEGLVTTPESSGVSMPVVQGLIHASGIIVNVTDCAFRKGMPNVVSMRPMILLSDRGRLMPGADVVLVF